MEIDQCLLESLPIGQRQRLVRRMRCDQIRAYYEREKSLQRQQGGVKVRPPSTLRRKARVRFSQADIIQDAIIRHDDKEVMRLLKEGADPNIHTASGGSLLHLCARHDNVFAAELLIERGLNVNLQDEDLWTALHVACVCDHADMVLLLLLAGVNVLLQDVNGNIPLDYATEGTETSYILRKHLEENGVDVSSMHTMKMQRSNTMLSDVRQLVTTGGSLNQPNDEGVTLLHIACASGYREVVSVLMDSGADPHPADNNFWTPLHLAAKYGQTSIVSQLLRHRANPTLLNCNQDKPSDIAASEPIADMLLTAEESWLQRLKDPSAPLPSTDQRYDGGSHDLSTPLKNLNPLGLSISKRDSLLEKCAMFRDAGGALSRQPSQDNGLDGPFSSGAGKLEQVKLMPPAPNDDLASLSELTDSSLLYEMQKRFGNDQIYTYIGHILLLVNPNKELPIYSTLVSQLYLSSTGRLCSSLPPHIFSSAERAYHMMLQERRPQCFILSGESGSGKTEAYKHIVRHLTARSSPKGLALESRMKHVNCILEAFGHAKTRRNNNSSRFIKLLTIQYCDKRRTLLRARLYTYMLEKSRLVHLPPHQHSFSIFYLMAEGMSPEEHSALYLSNVLAHRYLGGGLPGEKAPVATASTQSRERLAAVKQALRALGFNKQEVDSVFTLLSAVLHIGDLRFTALTDADTAFPSDLQLLERVAGMLQVCSNDLSTALTSDIQYFKGDVITRRHTVEMSEQYRDHLAKAIYGRLFSYLVNSMNDYLQGQDDSIGDPALEIGILDIFGFEDFQRNGFEQLCVNMTNERLRQYVSEVLFQQEQAECLQEGIAMETPRSHNSQSAVLDFFLQKPQGLLCVLDEESQSLRPAEQTLYKRLSTQLDSNPTPGLSFTTKDGNGNPPPKDQGPAFTVSHYAGQISYDFTGSLTRNKDSLPQNLLFTMKSSESVLLQQLFQSKLTQTGSLVPAAQGRAGLRGPKAALLLHRMPSASLVTANTVSQQPRRYHDLTKILKKKGSSSFLQRLERCGPITTAVQLRNSLSELISKLQACTPHFVECVRPNASGQPDSFDSFHVSTQLQYIGVLEMVRVIRYGYPVRLSFPGFLSRYKDLVIPTLGDKKKLSPEERCRSVLQQSKLQGWQMGSSKVFLRYWQADQLNDRCYQLHKKIITCQKVVRGWLARQRVHCKLSLQQKEEGSLQRFLQGAEDMGLQTYDQLVIQNASDIARESDRLRCHGSSLLNTLCNSPPLGERPEPVGKEEDQPVRRVLEKIGKVYDGPVTGGGRVIRHFRSSSVPTPLPIENMVLSSANPSIKPALQQVAHTNDDGAGGGGLSSPRKQPPPKPKRDPNTRLSASYEAVSAGLVMAAKECPTPEGCGSPAGSPPKSQLSPTDPAASSKPRPHSDDYTTMRKVPPPKPKRSPNTKLTGSYEEINAVAPQLHQLRPADVKLALLSRAGGFGGFGGLMQRAASIDAPQGVGLSLFQGHDEEDVYIEMLGSQQRARSLQEPPDSPEFTDSEAVYEEMKYFHHEDGGAPTTVVSKAAKLEALGLGLVGLGTSPPKSGDTKRGSAGVTAAIDTTHLHIALNNAAPKTPHSKDGSCDIPAPFPNLLPHRPPLLVFPPSPVTCSPASDESPLTPLEVKKLPVFETNLNYATGPDSPLSPQYARQRADSSPSLTVLMPEKKSTPPLTPPPPPPPPCNPPPPYRPPSHFPFPPEANFLALTRAASVTGSSDSPKTSASQRAGGEPLGKPPPYSPVKMSRPEPRRAHSCSSSPLLFNPANGRPLTSPLDELNTLFSSGRSLLRKSTSGRKMRDGGFNSNINLPGREDSGSAPTSPSLQLQDKNANNHTSHSSSPAPLENGNQISNGSLEDESHSKSNTTSSASLHRHMDSHHTQRGHLNFSPFGAGAAL
ncbi:unconventional myosin-XVI isoform X3 [Notolabrus celidotus]|uniref:unconventional myosin-XVI isoform X3 n=1 Tax=Notolabrus celidotus TaxID=1203425 RepID=UPI00148F6E83|nr:unconventional myosin-XVI isoform X3 [Notolabrus celidotus]XP_034549270.1 unconventional myosin-XVI isoform X3 [Notolabrus celidotus]